MNIVTTNTMDNHAINGEGKTSTYLLPISAVTNCSTRNVAHIKRKKSRYEHIRLSKAASTSGTNHDMINDQNMLNPLSQSCNSIESCYLIDSLTGKGTSSQPLSQTMASNDSNCLAPPKVKKRKCVLCVTQGCGGQFVCQKLTLYSGLPLKAKISLCDNN